MALNVFDVPTTRRLSLGLLGASGALLLAALNLVGSGISADDRAFVVEISRSITPLALSAATGLVSLIFAEIAAHPSTPSKGHPHSAANYLQTAFAMISVGGLGALLYGGYRLVSAATIAE